MPKREIFKQYQIDTGNYIYTIYNKKKPDGIVIADEVGLGKTYEVLKFLERLKTKRSKAIKVLIVLPSRDIFSHWIGIINKLYGEDKFWNDQIKVYFRDRKNSNKVKYINIMDRKIYKKLKVLFITKNDLISTRVKEDKKRKKKKIEQIRIGIFKNKVRKLMRFNPDIVIFDEFHNFKKLIKTPLDKPEKKDNIAKLLIYLKDKKKFKIYISATPFKPLVNPKKEVVDIVSPVIDNLIHSYKEDSKVKDLLKKYFESIIELREENNEDFLKKVGEENNEDFLKKVRDIEKFKTDLEKRLKTYIIENRRKIEDHRLEDKECFENGKVEMDEDFMNRYLKLHEKIYKLRYNIENKKEKNRKKIPKKGRNKLNILVAEQLLTSGKKTLDPKYNNLSTCKRIKFKDIKPRSHIKLQKLREIITERVLKNIDILVIPNKGEKFVLFCYFKASPAELKDEIMKAIKEKLNNKIGKNEIQRIKKKLINILDKKLETHIDKKDPNYDYFKNNIKDILVSYFTNKNVYNILKAKYKFKNYDEFIERYIRYKWSFVDNEGEDKKWSFIDILINYIKNEKDDKVINIIKERAKDIDIIEIYGHTHGGGKDRGKKKHKKTSEVYNKELRTLFNSPFLPLGLITTNIGAEGIDFHKYCRNVIHYDIWWMPSRMEQRVGRVDRVDSYVNRLRMRKGIMNKKSGNILDGVDIPVKKKYKESNSYKIIQHYMAINGTVDEYIYERFQERKVWTFLIGGRIFNMERFFKGASRKLKDQEEKALKRLRLNLEPYKRGRKSKKSSK